MIHKILKAIRDANPEKDPPCYGCGTRPHEFGCQGGEMSLHLEHLLRAIPKARFEKIHRSAWPDHLWFMFGHNEERYNLTLSVEDNLKTNPELVALLTDVLDIK